MEVKFLENGIRITPKNPEDNKKMSELFTVRNPPRMGSKPKVLVQQLVDQFGEPLENQYFLFIHADPKSEKVIDIPCEEEEVK
jgi:hypothetical protein